MAINPKQFGTDEKYFADNKYMTNSKIKRFMDCEVKGLEPFGKPSEAMQIGSYVDSYVSGTLEQFRKDNPDIFYKNDKTKLKTGFRKADEICEFIDNDNTIQQFLSGNKQTVVTGEIAEVPFKAKLDIYSKGIAINDLKIIRSLTDRQGNYYDFITQWRYDIQMSIYQELIYQNTGEKLPCFIVAITKEDTINSAIIKIDQPTLDFALEEVEQFAPRAYDVMIGKEEPIGCGICDICIEHREETPILTLGDLQGGGY